MEKSKKLLKELSIVILVFAILSLARMIVEVSLNGFVLESLSEEFSPALVKGVYIAVWVIGVLFLIPDFYIGWKGINIANKPNGSKAHIIWAKVLFVFSIIAFGSAIIDIFYSGDLVMAIITAVDVLLDVVLYFLYIKYATQIRNNNTNV